MSTPFELLRRHQKVLLAAVTGTAVLSFIVSDANNNAGEMSPIGVAALVIGSLAVVGWVWGTRDGKSGEKAMLGGALGLAIILVFMLLSKSPAEISTLTGNVSKNDLENLGRQRSLANQMVNRVFFANPMNQMIARFQPDRARPPLFGFGFEQSDETKDLLLTELLNRDADELGIEVTDEAAMAMLKQAATSEFDGLDPEGKSKDILTQEVFTNAIQQTSASFPGTNEDTIIAAIRREMRARQALNVQYSGNRMTPADVWDLHRKLNTRQSAQIVAIPVENFVDKTAKPSEADLTQTFEEYKANLPGSTANNVPEEGRPGLYLQRRMRVGYVEPDYAAIEKLAGEVTEEEIVARYEQQYKKAMPAPDPHGGFDFSDISQFPEMPPLPNVPKAPVATPDPAAPTTEKPADPATPAPEKPTDPAAPATEKPADPTAKPDGASLRPRASKLQPVVLIPDQPAAEAAPAAEAPATENPAAPAAEGEKTAAPAAEEKPAADKPAGDEPAPPAGDKPAEVKPEADKPAAAPLIVPPVDEMDIDIDPAPPVAKIRPLTEELRKQIRDEILAEKTKVLLEDKTDAARDVMNDLHLNVSEHLGHLQSLKLKKKAKRPETALSPEEATQKLQEYAKLHGLKYDETPLLTREELRTSEDHPLGGTRVREQGQVADVLDRSQPDVLCSASTAFDLANQTSYAFWKIEDVKAHIPASMEEPGVKDKVIQIWRTMRARPLAEKRAQALVDLIKTSDKPVAEALAEQTVTGDKDKSLFVTVLSPGEFAWLERPFTPQQMNGNSPPRLGAIQGVELAGPSFMTKVFNDMKPGDTAVVPNFDRSVYYVTRIDTRSPGTEAEVAVMRKQFLESQGELSAYAMGQSRVHDTDFVDRLYIKHGVIISSPAQESGE